MSHSVVQRIENALWGAFIGDALAMPVHWFYSPENIRKQFPGGIDRYYPAPHPHPDAFMLGMGYQPDVEKARAAGRNYDILHQHARFYHTTYSDFGFSLEDRDGEHGNATAALDKRMHYHHRLEAGESTLGAGLIRVLMRSIINRSGYSQDGFLDDFIRYMTQPRDNRDPYTEIYLRRWFEHYSLGEAPENCAEHQRRVWSIGSVGGLVRPLVLALLDPGNPYLATGMALGHQQLTHRSEMVSSGLSLLVPALLRLVNGEAPETIFRELLQQLPAPAVSGQALFQAYRDHDGPGNIPADEIWRLHMSFLSKSAAAQNPEYFATACYIEQALPLMAALGNQQNCDFIGTLRANAEAGGDSVHRGMVLGLLLAAGSHDVPEEWQTGLKNHQRLAKEIRQFAAIAARGDGHLAL
ncbi:ADP-ribosylglycohydrolase family protein [Marinobacter sp. TBZ242]|uniref:ADP-ribosylglycohydrolase family protein n=1 Tax=Marinobacter azerbaijanicus TaxID=3050455 RepID=A0ABT7IHX8_9GAMM|nr:ADP-ribosylglycohydrolase family protein [Marinobacter sp. TBZ242]MDL0432753.1 ADP-ribosylglycohydrolase family protein [Marinobacter sp. TBZ242]